MKICWSYLRPLALHVSCDRRSLRALCSACQYGSPHLPPYGCGQTPTSNSLHLLGRHICMWTLYRHKHQLTFLVLQVAFGVTLDGPVGHVWYTLLDRKVFPNEPTSNRAVVCKMLADQLLWAPFFSCVFFVFTNVLAVRPPSPPVTMCDQLCSAKARERLCNEQSDVQSLCTGLTT